MNSYKAILKTTGIFASLRVLSIIVNIATSKLIAVFVGVAGIGLYGLYTSALALITTIADLGVSRSAVRNIATATGTNDKTVIENTISIVSKLIFYTGFVGGLLTSLFSIQLSKWSFGDPSYWVAFCILGISVIFTIIKNGQTAILQGLRKVKYITQSSVLGAIITLLISVPVLLFFKLDGIIYVIALSSFISFITTKIYISKLKRDYNIYPIKLNISNTSNLVRLGLSLMLISFLIAISSYIIRAYISNFGKFEDLGLFQAGFQIISGYFGLIFTSMTTDYFPRISAIQDNNKKLEKEVNQQTYITLILIFPLVVVLPFLMPFIIKLLYSGDFLLTVSYVNLALFGVIFQAGSQAMDMILIAKNNSKLFTIVILVFRFLFIITSILGYHYYGIGGLGLSYSINMFLHLIGMCYLNYKVYNIKFNNETLKLIIIIFLVALVSFFLDDVEPIFKWFGYFTLFSFSIYFSIVKLKNKLEITSITKYFKNLLKKD